MTRSTPLGNAAAWLIGTWRSDRDKTLAGWIWPPGAQGAKLRKVMAPSFGKLTIRYTAKRIYWRFENAEFEWRPCRIGWANRENVFLVFGVGTREEGQLLHFTSRDEYWVHAGKGIEYFARQQDA